MGGAARSSQPRSPARCERHAPAASMSEHSHPPSLPAQLPSPHAARTTPTHPIRPQTRRYTARAMPPSVSPEEAVRDLLELLDLEEIDENIYRRLEREAPPGATLRRAGRRTVRSSRRAGRVGDQPAHSLHGYFLRPGDPAVPVVYTVDRFRDGRSFTTRRVGRAAARQGDLQHGRLVPRGRARIQPPAHDARGCQPARDGAFTERVGGEALGRHPPTSFAPGPVASAPSSRGTSTRRRSLPRSRRTGPSYVWLRAAAPLPDDPFLHQCVLTYATDMSLLDSIVPTPRPASASSARS